MTTTLEKLQNAEIDHNKGLNCAQSVVKQFCPEEPQKLELALKISSGFGGGMKTGSVCGALSGGIMALGLTLGSQNPAFKKNVEAPVKELIRRFIEIMEHSNCQNIIGYNVNIPEQRELAISQGIMQRQCSLAINTAIEIVDEIVLSYQLSVSRG